MLDFSTSKSQKIETFKYPIEVYLLISVDKGEFEKH